MCEARDAKLGYGLQQGCLFRSALTATARHRAAAYVTVAVVSGVDTDVECAAELLLDWVCSAVAAFSGFGGDLKGAAQLAAGCVHFKVAVFSGVDGECVRASSSIASAFKCWCGRGLAARTTRRL